MRLADYLKSDNILGFAFTKYKVISGVPYISRKPVVVFFVKQKLPMSEVPKEFQIPPTYAGLLTDVIETTQPTSLIPPIRPPTAGLQTDRFRPVLAGISGAGETSTACTITGFFGDPHTGNVYIVTAGHCASRIDWSCEINGSVGKRFLQPSPIDGGILPNDVIGTVVWVSQFATNMSEDLALVMPNPGLEWRNILAGLRIPFNGEMRNPGFEDIGRSILKSGRTTGTTIGRIYAIGGMVKIYYGACGTNVVSPVVVTTKMIERGDSGAPAIDFNGTFYGIFIGTSSDYSFFVPASKVAEKGLLPIRETTYIERLEFKI